MYKIILVVVVIILLLVFAVPYSVSYSAPEEPDSARIEPIEPVGPVKPTIKEYAEQRVNEVFGGHWVEFNELIWRESKWKPEAQNPHSTAYGLGQFLNSTWKTVDCVKTSDPYKQIDCTIKYVKARYKHPTLALQYHNKYNWY